MCLSLSLYIYIYIYIYTESERETYSVLRGWRNTVGLVLFDVSNSMKSHPSDVHAYTSELRPAIGFCLSPKYSMRLPTSFRQPLVYAHNLYQEIRAGFCDTYQSYTSKGIGIQGICL